MISGHKTPISDTPGPSSHYALVYLFLNRFYPRFYVYIACKFVCDISILLLLQIEKSQGEIYRLRAKLESTQTENENMADELEKMQRALNQSYADRDRIGSDLDKIRDDLERSQVNNQNIQV